MEYSINIGHFTVHSLSNNANINFKSTVQDSHTANSNWVNSCVNFGDYATVTCTQDSLIIKQSENTA